MSHRFRLAFGLCVRDMLVDWRMSVCFVLGLVAVLTPLMIIFGLKTGLIDGLRDRLVADPRNLEVVIVGSQQFDDAWFRAMRARDDVGFVQPNTRAIAATMTITVARASGLSSGEVADLIATGAGDPLLIDLPMLHAPDGSVPVIVSTPLVEALSLTPGGTATGLVQRRRDGRRETAEVTLFVSAVAPPVRTGRKALYVPVDLMEATETFRDGFGVPDLGWKGPARPSPRIYHAGARLYARNLRALVTLTHHLAGQGLTVRSKAGEVDDLNRFADSLTGGFLIIAMFSVIGFTVSLAASLWSNFERKRQSISFLRLLGMRSAALIAIPIYQALLIAVVGFAAALAAFFGASAVIEVVFSDIADGVDGALSVLRPLDVLAYFLATVSVAMLASCLSASGVARISPAEGLRER